MRVAVSIGILCALLTSGHQVANGAAAVGEAAASETVTSITCPSSLQRRIDRAAPGSTLEVPACIYRETIRIDKPLVLVTDGATIDGGRIRKYGIVVTADDVVIQGFEVRRTRNPAQEGAIQVRDSNRFTLRGAYVHNSGGACISIVGGSGHVIAHSTLAYCAQEGFHLSRVTNTRVAYNRIHHNNPDSRFDMEWEAGGGKASHSSGLTFVGNEVYRNRGPGLWCDLDCRNVVYRENRVRHNRWAGIMFEISDGARIVHNRVWENGWGKRTWGWGAGILISSSRNAEVAYNTVAWNADGISVVSQDRSDSYAFEPGVSTWNRVTRVRVHDNAVYLDPQRTDRSDKFAVGWIQDWAGVMFRTRSHNVGAHNSYWYGSPEPTRRFAWRDSVSRLRSFNWTPGEAGGVYMTPGQRDRRLACVGVPLRPQTH